MLITKDRTLFAMRIYRGSTLLLGIHFEIGIADYWDSVGPSTGGLLNTEVVSHGFSGYG